MMMRRSKNLCLPPPLILLLLLIIFTSHELLSVTGLGEKSFYIVFLEDRPGLQQESAVQTHINVLSSVKESLVEAKESMVYSYTKSINAFAAKLSSDEADKLSQMDEVLSVIPNRYRKLHTTRSWDFTGFPITAKRKLMSESDVIVGLLDTGITPGSESFKDDGFGPIPKRWKGSCVRAANFSGCNKKLIGAKYFKLDGNHDPSDISSPVDADGHGTHTSSTAVGNVISNASLFGLGNGTARGAVPSARVAMYKVCWASFGCADMDILAAFEAAIDDGVDVISVSIGGGSADFLTDSIAVGSFHAMKKGIITAASAGNDGPALGMVTNTAPWLFTIAASGIDRSFRSQIQLGNGKSFLGVGINSFNPNQKLYPLVSGTDIAQNAESKDQARFCFDGTLDAKKAKGKLVLCALANWGTDSVVKGIGGVGTILENDQFLDAAQIFMAPGTLVNSTVGETINDYIHSTRAASAVIHKTTEVKIRAPFIASFSSRGPNPASKRVLKPDIAAPGIDILASYTPLKSLTGLKGDTQFSKFTLMSGTSMACPHVAGVAAYVKSFHPQWSPAAIRSAIITTATPMSRRVNADGEFAYGAGQVNPRRAVSPGLVYDMNDMSYIQFLCLEGFNSSSIAHLVGSRSINCSSLIPGLGYDALNYPTFQLTVNSNKPMTIGIYRRTVTNVGRAKTVYNVSVKPPKGVEITVTPPILSFTRTLQRRSFKVVVKANKMSFSAGSMVSGSLSWKSPRYVVKSPVVVHSPVQENNGHPHIINVDNVL
ncbi:subtilisin-like protease SBT4.14 [Humulus lupulus]|uniref:subtilisin-like protease SBT4.14 n=1 Tax=Humulus lupulus TaxID=3486 RepID=UPI002B4157AB|nr:subtilisin-like protease SBT4.14 [Humulus lupulus]